MGASLSRNTSWPRQVVLGIAAVAVAGLAAVLIGRTSTSKPITDREAPEEPHELTPRKDVEAVRQASSEPVQAEKASSPPSKPDELSPEKASPNGPSSSTPTSEAKSPVDPSATSYSSATMLLMGQLAERSTTGDLGFRSKPCDETRQELIELEVPVETVGAHGIRPTVYCDLDGTLCDFEGEAAKIFKCAFQDIDKRQLWQGLQRTKDFYNKLPWHSEGRQLWDGIQVLAPVILSGVPRMGGAAASTQKRKWVRRELGEHVPILTCFKPDKWRACRSGDILIDDDAIHRRGWEEQGGIFVHHTGESSATLALLAQLFVLPPQPNLEPVCWVQAKWSGEWWWCKVFSQEGAFTEVEFMEPPFSGEKYMMTASNIRAAHGRPRRPSTSNA